MKADVAAARGFGCGALLSALLSNKSRARLAEVWAEWGAREEVVAALMGICVVLNCFCWCSRY